MIEGYINELKCTVRACIDCGTLVAGGQTRCYLCAQLSEKSKIKRNFLKWLLK